MPDDKSTWLTYDSKRRNALVQAIARELWRDSKGEDLDKLDATARKGQWESEKANFEGLARRIAVGLSRKGLVSLDDPGTVT